jgi:hypothetical protein
MHVGGDALYLPIMVGFDQARERAWLLGQLRAFFYVRNIGRIPSKPLWFFMSPPFPTGHKN